jgi:predicted DsbA family dithiol-disulfide isomerase
MNPIARIDVISDAICPWCFIGKRHLEGALAELAGDGLVFDVAWHAFQLNPDMPEEGVDRRAYRIQKFGSWEKSLELDARITEAGAAAGLAFRTDLMRRTPNTLAAHRTVRLARAHGVQDAVMERVFVAYFQEGRDIGDPEVLDACAAEAGVPAGAVAAMLAGDEGRDEVLAEDLGARRSGINGVPSFAMQGHLLFSGAMPAETMAQAFRRAWGILKDQAA